MGQAQPLRGEIRAGPQPQWRAVLAAILSQLTGAAWRVLA